MPEMPPIPTFYYSPLSPIAAIIKAVAPNTVIVTGLGAGGLNCFMAPGRHFTFIEIDPLMEQVAREHFDFLSQCTPPTVIIGDGRLKMLEQPEGAFDLIILDAFASDSIPTHLVTQEAFAIYLKHLRPGGAMAIHISNRFFNLEPMLAALTKNLGLYARFGESMTMGATREAVFLPTRWVVVAPDEAIITRIESQNPMWRNLQENPAIKAWTDEYSNLLAVMKWHSDAIAIPLPNPTEAR
jgi:spermidine synthase